MTPLQNKIYHFIDHSIKQNGYSPTLAEIAIGIGISPNSISLISRSVHQLVTNGKLKFHKKGYRNIQISNSNLQLPIKKIPISDYSMPTHFDLKKLVNHSLFLVEHELNHPSILRGDLIICNEEKEILEGDYVLASIDEKELVIQHISFKIHDRITLIPTHSSIKPKAYLKHRITLHGIYAGVLRIKD